MFGNEQLLDICHFFQCAQKFNVRLRQSLPSMISTEEKISEVIQLCFFSASALHVCTAASLRIFCLCEAIFFPLVEVAGGNGYRS